MLVRNEITDARAARFHFIPPMVSTMTVDPSGIRPVLSEKYSKHSVAKYFSLRTEYSIRTLHIFVHEKKWITFIFSEKIFSKIKTRLTKPGAQLVWPSAKNSSDEAF